MNRIGKVWLVGFLVAFVLLLIPPSWSADKDEQGTLDFKPHELLPTATKEEDIGIRVRLQAGKDPNILKVSAPSKDYKLEITLKMDEKGNLAGFEPLHWSKGAIHEIAESISFAGYSFEPAKGSVLTFRVEPDKGYVYVSGKGSVTGPDKKTLTLDETKKGLVLGHPAKPKEAKPVETKEAKDKP